jgi:hypothetical protein
MRLLTIDDLLTGDPEEVDTLIAKGMGLSDMYEDYLANDEGDTHLREPGIHASEIKCERAMVYSLNGEERKEKSAPEWKRRFKVGHVIHDMFQTQFEKMAGMKNSYVTFEREVKIHPCPEQPIAAMWDIHSHTDGLFTVREAPEAPPIVRVLLEIKTESASGYESLKEPRPDHEEQGTVYMKTLDTPLIWFLYFNKGNQNYTPSTNPNFFCRYKPAIWDRIEKRIEFAHTHHALKTLPDRRESVKCEFCSFSWTCNPACLNKMGRGHAKQPAHWGK